ncbi:hypothetical protein [Methanothermobacter sp.]|uniref:hypothetical protein n=1 Tax=Methanothermobacter sp. TaxID=1884223 RepID=UPI003C7154F0
MHETRLRDILSVDSNLEILSGMINEKIGADHEFRLISKELPLPIDVIGLQNRYCDIVLAEEEQNIYILELKNAIRSIKSVESQVLEYKDLMKKTLDYVNNDGKLFYQHKIFLKYFEYVGLNPAKIKNIIPLIVSAAPVKKSPESKEEVRCLYFKDLDKLVNNYSKKRISLFKSTYEVFWDNKIRKKVDLLINRYRAMEFVPLVYEYFILNNGESHLNLVFESLNNYKKEYVNLGEVKKDDMCQDLPAVFQFNFEPETIFEKVLANHNADENEKKFSIQIFRSGLTNPIIYLENDSNWFIPLIQTKPVTFTIDSIMVNDVIAFDARERSSDKNLFYDDVILLDRGTYTIEKIEEYGVFYYLLRLNGKECSYEFKVYSPKFRNIDELLPYMNPQKVKEVLNNIKLSKGSEYLFKGNNGQIEWINSKMKLI